MPDKCQDTAYCTMPIYDIEQTKPVFDRVLQMKVTVLVSELCCLSLDILNQFWNAIPLKQKVASNAATMLEPNNSDPSDETLPTFTFDYNKAFSLASNLSTTGSLSSDTAKSASIDPVKTYIELLPPSKPQVILTVTNKSQSIWSIAMFVNKEIECIVDSGFGLQIISMLAKITNSLGIIYNPNIILNMQSTNGTMDKSLGLARNVLCISNITLYLQIHIL